MSNDAVAKPSRLSACGDPVLKKVRSLRGGVEVMRAAGKAYLPKEERESEDDYKERLARSWFYPALDEAIEDDADRVFTKEVQLGDDVPANLKELAENITAEGRNLNTFARDLFEDGIEAGISFILIDGPERPEGATRKDEAELNLRPFVTMIRAEDVIGWQTSTIGTRTVLQQVRIAEKAYVPDSDNPWEPKEVEQIREMNRGDGFVTFTLWQQNDSGDWVPIKAGTIELPEIPLVPFYTKRTGFFRGKPFYATLADLNVAHWQSASDQRQILHVARVPVLALFGFDSSEVTIAAHAAIFSSKGPQDADAKYVEHTGAAIEAGRNDLKDLEDRMAQLGLKSIMPTPGNPTATGQALESVKATTPLAMMANSLKDALEAMLDFLGQFLGNAPGKSGSLTVNTDFGLSLLNGADLTFLLQAVNTGQISRVTFLRECVRRNVLMDDLVPEEEIERIDDEAPEPVTAPVDNGNPIDDQNNPADNSGVTP